MSRPTRERLNRANNTRIHRGDGGASALDGDPQGHVRRLGVRINDALNPELAQRPVKSFATMTEEEREEMRRKYAKR